MEVLFSAPKLSRAATDVFLLRHPGPSSCVLELDADDVIDAIIDLTDVCVRRTRRRQMEVLIFKCLSIRRRDDAIIRCGLC